MTDNASGPTIYERIVAIIGELPPIGKDQRNEQQGFMFRGHDDVLNALNPLLAKHGVIVVPDVIDRAVSQRTTSRGSVMFEVNLHVRFTFYGAGGDSFSGSTWGEGTDMGDKATSKAMTMAFKSMLNQAFAISNKETADPDAGIAEEASGKPAANGATSEKAMEVAATVAQQKKLDRLITNLATAKPDTDWADIAERAAQRDFGHGRAELGKVEIEQLAAKLNEHYESLLVPA